MQEVLRNLRLYGWTSATRYAAEKRRTIRETVKHPNLSQLLAVVRSKEARYSRWRVEISFFCCSTVRRQKWRRFPVSTANENGEHKLAKNAYSRLSTFQPSLTRNPWCTTGRRVASVL